MSSPPQVRRTDRVMPDEKVMADAPARPLWALATVGSDGSPYCVPLLYVWLDGQVFVHNTAARGHLRTNVEHDESRLL